MPGSRLQGSEKTPRRASSRNPEPATRNRSSRMEQAPAGRAVGPDRSCPAIGGAVDCGDAITAFHPSGAAGRPPAPTGSCDFPGIPPVRPAPRGSESGDWGRRTPQKTPRRGADSSRRKSRTPRRRGASYRETAAASVPPEPGTCNPEPLPPAWSRRRERARGACPRLFSRITRHASAPPSPPQQREAAEGEQAEGRRLGDDVVGQPGEAEAVVGFLRVAAHLAAVV